MRSHPADATDDIHAKVDAHGPTKLARVRGINDKRYSVYLRDMAAAI